MDQEYERGIINILNMRLGVEQKRKFDKEDIFGNTPLVYCIKKKWTKLATELINGGFYNPQRTDRYTMLTPIHNSCSIIDDDFLQLIIKKFDFCIDAKDFQGNTALHYACWNRNKKLCEILIENGANVNEQNNEGNTPLHIACASNNPKFDHSSKLEELLLKNGADIDAKNKMEETPLMVLFKLDGEDENINSAMKYDPITTLMVLLNSKADINCVSNSKKTPLHYACIRGSTISALTLMNNGADCNALDYSETTPYGYALKNNHEDLCIFLIQQNNIIDVPVNSVIVNPDHICNKISALQDFANSPQIDELFKQKRELDKKPNFQKLEEGYCKLQPYSPFYFAIKSNMQGNIYLLIQKGFDEFSALSESLIQNKYNLFMTLAETVKNETIKDGVSTESKNLFHVLAEHCSTNMRDIELVNDVFNLLVQSNVDRMAKDKYGRMPLHYAYKSGNMYIASKLMEDMSVEQKVEILNTQDLEMISVFGMLFENMSKNEVSSSPLTQEVLNIVGLDILKLNPFVRFHKKCFPYTQLSYSLENQEMIHPLILYNDVLRVNELKPIADCFDLTGIGSPDKGLSAICQMFKLGRVGMLSNDYFYETVAAYLSNKSYVKWIEETLSKVNQFGAYQNIERIKRFVKSRFGISLSIEPQVDNSHRYNLLKAMDNYVYDYERDSEEYLDEVIPKLMEENNNAECVLDSTEATEKHCTVVKDEEEPGYYFDALMKKVDIKKYYYGLDNFYVLQILWDEVKKLYIVWTRWGRSGSIGQYQRTPFNKLEDAKKEFIKIFKQKSGWIWKDIKGYYKIEKRYDIKRIGGKLTSKDEFKLKFSNADFKFEKLLIPESKLNTSIPMVNPVEFKYFIKPLITDNNMHNALKSSNFSNSMMLLAPQDQKTIDQGVEILNKIAKLLEESEQHRWKHNFEKYCACIEEVSNLNSEYLEVIPKVNPTLITAILHKHQVDAELKMLKSAFTLSYSVRAMLGAYKNQDRVNPYDYMIGTIGAQLSIVDQNSEETNLILHYLNSDKLYGYNLRNIVKVEDVEHSKDDDRLFNKTDNHMMLWHGTSATNVLSIIKNGLKIAPADEETHGSRFGRGLYFSDSFNLSSCYSAESEQEKYICLCEVATGRMINIISSFNQKLKGSDEYDCIRSMPSSGPDWDGTVVKDNIVYPIGRIINYPPPFLKLEKYVPQSKVTAFQSHVQGIVAKSSRSKLKVTSKADYDIIEDKSSDSEINENSDDSDDDKDKEPTVQTIFGGLKQPRAKGKRSSKSNKNKLNIIKDERLDNIYPLLPNEVTAFTHNEAKNMNNFFGYQSHRSEYIIYNEALVRIRYIVQLSSKPKELLEKEHIGQEYKKTRGYSKRYAKNDVDMDEY